MKKFLTILLTVVLTAAVAITGTVAYLTAEDSDVNTMTFGNVKIAQHEFERVVDANGNYTTIDVDGTTSYELKEFTQDKPLYPIVGDPNSGYDSTTVRLGQLGHNSRGGMDVLTPKNVQDKFVVVENTGISDAYVRTVVAFEAGSLTYAEWNELINYSFHFTWKEIRLADTVVEIDGNNYVLVEFVYNGYEDVQHPNGVLKPGDYTYNSLAQVYLKSEATYEDCEALDGNGNGRYDILVFSQAVQVKGFEDVGAEKALDTAFGDVTATAHPWVDNAPVIPGVINSVEKLQAALDNAVNGDVITLGADIEGDVTVTQKADTKITIDGNGKTFAGVLTVDGKSATYLTAGLTVKNVNFKADSISADACINLGKSGDNNTRYTCNVTVENCTFDVPGAVGVKSYTGGDKNLVIRNCTATASAHSLVQAKGIDGVLVEGCKVYSKNGLNFNNSDNVTVDNCTVDVKGYAVRFGESSGGVGAAETYLIKNSSLKSANEDGDAVIILRGTADYSTLTIENTTITGTPDITNNAAGATVVK